MRTADGGAAFLGGSRKRALQVNSVGHFTGFFAEAALPSATSTNAYTRSPKRPYCVTSASDNSSPCIDLTGYRQREATFPSSVIRLSAWKLPIIAWAILQEQKRDRRTAACCPVRAAGSPRSE